MNSLNQHSFSVSDWWNGLIGVGASLVGWHYDYVPDPSQDQVCSVDCAHTA